MTLFIRNYGRRGSTLKTMSYVEWMPVVLHSGDSGFESRPNGRPQVDKTPLNKQTMGQADVTATH
jgi:hypothetical protein